MDKYLCRKDVYDEIEKAMRDRSHLTQKLITDKNGKQRKVWVRPGENPVADKGKKVEETTEKTPAKPKHSVGDTVTLDGAKGDFKVSSIDKDGTYHVVSADGKKGYKVSENHITGNKGNSENKKEVEFEKKNQASKTEDIARKNDAENNVNDAIKISNSEKNVIFSTLTPEFMSSLENKEPTTIGNMILNNLYSTGKKDLFNKIRQQEWDYKDANGKHGNTFNSDYAKEAMYQLYQEYKNNPKESEKKEQKNSSSDTDKALETYRNQINDIKKTNPSAYIEWVGQANKDYKKYKEFKEKADTVARAPMFATFPEYATAKHEAEKLEKKYPDFKELNDKHMAYYKFE